MSPITKLAAIAPVPHGMICRTMHSKLAGDSAIRGGFTVTEGSVDSPASTTSLSSGGNEQAKDWFSLMDHDVDTLAAALAKP